MKNIIWMFRVRHLILNINLIIVMLLTFLDIFLLFVYLYFKKKKFIIFYNFINEFL